MIFVNTKILWETIGYEDNQMYIRHIIQYVSKTGNIDILMTKEDYCAFALSVSGSNSILHGRENNRPFISFVGINVYMMNNDDIEKYGSLL